MACAVVLAGTFGLASCGGSEESGGSAQLDRFGSAQSLQLFTCTDWQKASPQTRKNVVQRLRQITGSEVTGEGTSGRGTVLDDDQAYRLFDGYCGQTFARGFTLYKLYGQAAGFAGRAP